MDIAVDVGSGVTKAKSKDKEIAFPSYVCPVSDAVGYGRLVGSAPEIVSNPVYHNEEWLIGEDARTYGDSGTFANTLSDKWAGSNGWLALMYAALARLGVSGDVHLVTGLPQSFFLDQYEDLVKTLSGKHEFSYKGETYRVNIRPSVLPQAGSVVFHAAQVKEGSYLMTDTDVTAGVIDIGTYTTGLAAMEGMRFAPRQSGGVRVGVSQLLEEFGSRLQSYYDIKVDPKKLPSIIRTGRVFNRGKPMQVDGLISEIAGNIVGPVLDEVEKLWGGADDFAEVYIVGGGAHAFAETIMQQIQHAQLIDTPEYSVVRGMYEYARMLSDADGGNEQEGAPSDKKGGGE